MNLSVHVSRFWLAVVPMCRQRVSSSFCSRSSGGGLSRRRIVGYDGGGAISVTAIDISQGSGRAHPPDLEAQLATSFCAGWIYMFMQLHVLAFLSLALGDRSWCYPWSSRTGFQPAVWPAPPLPLAHLCVPRSSLPTLAALLFLALDDAGSPRLLAPTAT